MDAKTSIQILNNPRFKALESQKRRVGWTLSCIMLFIYFGYLTLVSTRPDLLHRSLSGGVTTVGIPLGVAVIVSAIILAGIYVWYANGKFDELTAQVVKESQS